MWIKSISFYQLTGVKKEEKIVIAFLTFIGYRLYHTLAGAKDKLLQNRPFTHLAAFLSGQIYKFTIGCCSENATFACV